MKTYIWQYLDGLTDDYHDGGGLVIVTDRKPRAALIASIEPKWTHLVGKYEALDLSHPDLVLDTPAANEVVYVFPDRGCC